MKSYKKENRINISLTLNTKKNIDESFQIYKKYKNLFEIDQVTSISELATIIHQYDNKEKIVCSYNEGIYSIESLQKLIKLNCFSAVVLGNKFLRDFRTFDYVTKNNLECILLINNGCVSECRNFCKLKGVCEQNFRNTLSNITPVELYSKESLFPEELHKYYISNKAIKLFKLSTRPIKKREYIDLLESYITGNSKPYILHNNFNYHLYGRLAFFKEFYNFFEYKDIISEKENIWKNIYFSHNKT